MTDKTAFTDDEWTTVLEGPTSAGMLMVFADKGGYFRETLAMGKAYAEARSQHGQSQLLDEIVASKPKTDRSHSDSPDDLKQHSLQNIRAAATLVELKATPEEAAEYKQFIVTLAGRVANAHKEDGVRISENEQAAIDEIAGTLGVPSI